jgi:hypothetical protein
MFDLLAFQSMLGFAMTAALGLPAIPVTDTSMAMIKSERDGFDSYCVSAAFPWKHRILEQPVTHLEIGVIAQLSQPDPRTGTISTSGVQLVLQRHNAAAFLAFFERYNDWLTANLGKATNWPMTLNFARVVRNSAAHGGINIRDPRSPPVSYRCFQYSHADNGRNLFEEDITLCEMIALLLDVDTELGKLNVPVL